MLKFKSLGSGSSGNATLVESTGIFPFRLLIDCGLGFKHLKFRLEEAGLQPEDIHAIFITHEHGDHIGCARLLSRRFKIPVWMSGGTYAAIKSPDFEGLLRTARDGESIDLGGLQITPFTVPHDAREPLQLTCTDGAAKLGILTDLGHVTAHVLTHLSQCDALLLEFNHDIELLAQSSYPAFLKKRVGGLYGHLSNASAVQAVVQLKHPGLKHVMAAHLSVQNNRPKLVQALLAEALSCDADDMAVAQPDKASAWLQL